MTDTPTAELSEVDINHETIGLIVARLTAELHDFAATRCISEAAIQEKLGAVYCVFLSYAEDLFTISPVIASGTSDLRVRITLNPAAYRRAAKAAKDRMARRVSGV